MKESRAQRKMKNNKNAINANGGDSEWYEIK